jgi:hypothetical protein
MDNSQKQSFEALARESCNCRECFDRLELGLKAPAIAIAQPRWVGPSYWHSVEKILIIASNPGSGDNRTDSADKMMNNRLAAFRDNPGSDLHDLFQSQANDMRNWGRGRFWRYYIDGLRLNLDEIAFANVAWCATQGNKYPPQMLSKCFSRFTGRLITILAPKSILLSGSSVHRYQPAIQKLAPTARIISMMHYAHREGRNTEEIELKRVRALLLH